MGTENKGTRSSRFRITTIAIAVASSFAMAPAWAAVSVGDIANGIITRQITGVAAGLNDTDAVNVAQPKEAAPAGTTTVEATGPNMTVTPQQDPKHQHNWTYTVGLNENLTGMKSAEFEADAAKTTISAGGVTIVEDSTTVSLKSNGLDNGGQTIKHVAAGENDTDAVNVAQLKKAASAATTTVNTTDPNMTVTEQPSDSHNYTVGLNKKLTGMESAEFRADTSTAGTSTSVTKISEDGLNIVKGNTTVRLTSEGLDNGGQTITGLAAGTADTDAVNVAQLKEVKGDASQAVTESKKHSSVVEGNNIKVTSQANAAGGTEYSVSTADNVSFSSVTVGAASISQAGIQAGSQKITNVAPGTISATSTDAVNGSQLYQTNQAVQQNSDDISKLYNRSAELNRKIHRAGAHAAALAALHPLDFDENHRVSASLGLGQYHSSGAAALGIFVRPTENFMVSLGGSIASGSDVMGNLGVHYRFGGDSVRVNKTELTQQVSTLTAENRDLSAKLASSNSKLEAATSKIDSLMERIHAIEAKLNMK